MFKFLSKKETVYSDIIANDQIDTKEKLLLKFFRVLENISKKGVDYSIYAHSNGAINISISLNNNGLSINKHLRCYFGDELCYEGSVNKTCNQILNELNDILNKPQILYNGK